MMMMIINKNDDHRHTVVMIKLNLVINYVNPSRLAAKVLEEVKVEWIKVLKEEEFDLNTNL